MSEDFKPFELMINAQYEADRQSLKIVHWEINVKALAWLRADPIGATIEFNGLLEDKTFMGHPFRIDHSDGPPSLKPVYESQGNRPASYEGVAGFGQLPQRADSGR